MDQADAQTTAELAARTDRLYEYDREPVGSEGLKPGRYFAGLFAGEHVAATEFVIGAFFVLHGVTLVDLLIGLAVGNLLAVLSWTFICAPIATRIRLTLYWYLRKIVGPGLTAVYNVANALLYCVLAGAMIAVATTAISVGVGLETPGLDAVLPESISWVVITFIVGSAITLVAVLGFDGLSRFASVCSPWIFAVFIAGAVAMLPRLGVETDLSNLWTVATTEIWNGVAAPGQEPFNVWHIVFFAWSANLAMHVALSDMALFRYARHWAYGLYSAFGMYAGHFLAWMCSGVMIAAVGREMNPGLMAYEAVGFAGAAAVLIAGWTTATPTLYRAGLALQTITPNWPRWKVTLATGLVTTILACFPVVFLRLLDYVAIYGLVLVPVGAIVFAEHWFFPKLGITQYMAEKHSWVFNWNAAIVWGGTLLACWWMPLHLFFRWLPAYLIALAAYTGLQWIAARRMVTSTEAAPVSHSVQHSEIT